MKLIDKVRKNVKKSTQELVSGFKPYDELCRDAAHNLAERNAIIKLLQDAKEKRLHKHYITHLRNQLSALSYEKGALENKEARIRKNATSEHKFII